MTGVDTYTMLEGVLVEEFQMRADDVSRSAKCSEIGLDSLTAAELAGVLQDRLHIEVYDYELLELDTLGDVADLVESRRRSVERQE